MPGQDAAPHAQASPAKRYIVDLDDDPKYRWKHIIADYKQPLQSLFVKIWNSKERIHPNVIELVSRISENLEKYVPPPYDQEMRGVSEAGGVTLGQTILANMMYEVSAIGRHLAHQPRACTSIVAEAPSGTIYHGRNLDYPRFTEDLKNLTVVVNFQSGGKTVYTGTTFVGYVGLLTGQRPHAYTIALNERMKGDWLTNAGLLESHLAAGANISFLIRYILEDTSLTFDAAITKLCKAPLLAPCYLSVGGVNPREGVVITRNRIQEPDCNIQRLDADRERWFIVKTNYDDGEEASDDRENIAIEKMNEIGRDDVNPDLLYAIFSTPNVLNDDTIYTTLMSASEPELYTTYVRDHSRLLQANL